MLFTRFVPAALALVSVLPTFAQAASEPSPIEQAIFETRHEAAVMAIRDNQENAKIREAFALLPRGKKHGNVLRCWVYGVDTILGMQSGVCRGGGRRYAMSALAIGISSEIHTGYLKFKASRDFSSVERLHGVRVGTYAGIGFEAEDLNFALSEEPGEISASGYGFGAGVSIEAIWVHLDQI